ncbi:MAG: hypothetical protein Q8R01_14730, partial [Ramlibacter sp.]|nr:hypothetical protein [Ramlibacter sp.]
MTGVNGDKAPIPATTTGKRRLASISSANLAVSGPSNVANAAAGAAAADANAPTESARDVPAARGVADDASVGATAPSPDAAAPEPTRKMMERIEARITAERDARLAEIAAVRADCEQKIANGCADCEQKIAAERRGRRAATAALRSRLDAIDANHFVNEVTQSMTGITGESWWRGAARKVVPKKWWHDKLPGHFAKYPETRDHLLCCCLLDLRE